MSLLGKATIVPVEPEHVGQYQKIIVPFLQDALEHTDEELSLRDILSDIANRKRQLWVVKHQGEFIAAVVTMIDKTKSGFKIGTITHAGGKDHDLWSHFPEMVIPWMKERGCKFIDIVGRQGWARKYRAEGFAPKYTVLRKGI